MILCILFCRSLFVLLFFFFWPLCCLSFFNLRILITPLVCSNSSFYIVLNSLMFIIIKEKRRLKQDKRFLIIGLCIFFFIDSLFFKQFLPLIDIRCTKELKSRRGIRDKWKCCIAILYKELVYLQWCITLFCYQWSIISTLINCLIGQV